MPVNKALPDRQGLSANVKAARSALERKVKSPRNFANEQSLIVTFVARATAYFHMLESWNDLNPLKPPNASHASIPSHLTIFSLALHLSSSSKLSYCLIPQIPIHVSSTVGE